MGLDFGAIENILLSIERLMIGLPVFFGVALIGYFIFHLFLEIFMGRKGGILSNAIYRRWA
jgi:hypothetical protein